MAEYDYVVSSIKVKQTAVFKLQDLYKILKKWFSDRNYHLAEAEYADTERKQFSIKWLADKKADDYTKFIIEVNIKGSNLEHLEHRGKKLQKGELEVNFASYLKSDYEHYWGNKFTRQFIRGIYDKFAQKAKMDKYHEELYEDTYAAYDEVKSFLKLHV